MRLPVTRNFSCNSPRSLSSWITCKRRRLSVSISSKSYGVSPSQITAHLFVELNAFGKQFIGKFLGLFQLDIFLLSLKSCQLLLSKFLCLTALFNLCFLLLFLGTFAGLLSFFPYRNDFHELAASLDDGASCKCFLMFFLDASDGSIHRGFAFTIFFRGIT